MVESLDNKINIEVLKINENEKAIEIIIRGENQYKSKGIIIHCTDNGNLDYEKLCYEIKDYKLDDLKKYLNEKKIIYNEINFI